MTVANGLSRGIVEWVASQRRADLFCGSAAFPYQYGKNRGPSTAPDQPPLEKFFQSHYVNCEWIMRIHLDAKDAAVAEYFVHRLALS